MVLMPMRLDGGVVKPELIILYLGRQTATHHAGLHDVGIRLCHPFC